MAKSMTQEARSAATSRKKTPPCCQDRQPRRPRRTAPAFQQYQAAVQLLQQGKYEKALAAFEKLLPTAPVEIVERCRMYIATCQRQIGKARPSPSLTPRNTTTTPSPSSTPATTRRRASSSSAFSPRHPASRLRLLRPGPARRHHRTHPGLPRQPVQGHRAQSQKPPPGPRRTTTFRAWWTIPASPSCCILRFRKAIDVNLCAVSRPLH